MNNRFLRFGKKAPMDRKKKNILLSIVILFELVLLCTVMSYAWVETISSIKLNNLDPDGNDLVPNTLVDTRVWNRVHLTDTERTVDLGKYFRQAGDMHLSPASSINGESFWFPEINPANNSIAYHSNLYRSGTIDDKNTTYMSVTFKLTTEAASDIYFNADPTFSVYSDKIRVSVKAVSDDPSNHNHSSETVTQTPAIFYKGAANTSADNTFSVVGAANGTSSNQSAHTFYKYAATNNSKTKLFRVNAGETMTVTVNLWLQHVSGDMDAVMSQALTITNFGLTSSQVPRNITLIPSSKWADGGTYYYYAWCWSIQDDPNSVLYEINMDPLTGHYTFQYNSSFLKTLFIRSNTANLTKDTVWNTGTRIQTIDTSIPDTPENPTAVITSKNSNNGKAEVSWIEPVEISVKPINGQSAAASQLSVTTYLDQTTNATSVMEQSTNTADSPHFRKAHGWHDKEFKLGATAASGWQFVGWYSDAAGTNLVSNTNAYYTNISTAAGGSKTYYARFKEVRTVQLTRLLDGVSSANGGTINITSSAGTTSGTNPKSRVVDKDSAVTLTATPATGYSFSGFYNVESGGSALTMTQSGGTYSATITAGGNNITLPYWARFTTNYYNVIAHACYSTDNGSSYTEDNATGGTVKVGDGDASGGATFTESVKFNTSVALTATAEAGYEFVGWRLGSTSGTTVTSPYNLNTAGEKHIYALFKSNRFTVTVKSYSSTDNGSSYANNTTGGNVQADSSSAGLSSSTLATVNGSTVALKATPQSGYVFLGWYTTANTSGTKKSSDLTYNYQLTDYDNVTLYAIYNKATIYLIGWLDKGAVTTTQEKYKFTQSSAGSSTFTLTYTFTNNESGYQYANIYYSEGTNHVYHPQNNNSGSGAVATKNDNKLNEDPKWQIAATNYDEVTFTWDYSTKKLTWSVTKYYYFDCSACSWFTNNGCVPGISYNYSTPNRAEFVSTGLYRIQIPDDVSTFELSRANENNHWNGFNVTKDGDSAKKKYIINADCNGGYWTN